MSLANAIQSAVIDAPLLRQAAVGDSAGVLTNIYGDQTNIAIWQRDISAVLEQAAQQIIAAKPSLKIAKIVTPSNAVDTLCEALGVIPGVQSLSEDIALLVDMFCSLFELKQVGLRLTGLDRAMCPRFHVDKVPCRLVSTYHGIATQWLEHEKVDRSKLGAGNLGLPDNQSGVYHCESDIQLMRQGDVALLKGESWIGNEGAGLVHRSPKPQKSSQRLLLTLDFIND